MTEWILPLGLLLTGATGFAVDALVPVSESQSKDITVYSVSQLQSTCKTDPANPLCANYVSLTPSQTSPSKVNFCLKNPAAEECRIMNSTDSLIKLKFFTDFPCDADAETCSKRTFAKCEDIYSKTGICDVVKQCNVGRLDTMPFAVYYRIEDQCPALSRGLDSCAKGNEKSCLTIKKIRKNTPKQYLFTYTCPEINNQLELQYYREKLDAESFEKLERECKISNIKNGFVQPSLAMIYPVIKNGGIKLKSGTVVPYNTLVDTMELADDDVNSGFLLSMLALKTDFLGRAGSNISTVPFGVARYRFPGFDVSPLRFNYNVRLMDWTYLSFERLYVYEDDFEPSCKSNELQKIYLTDRREKQSFISDKLYTHAFQTNRQTPQYLEFYNEKIAALSVIPKANEIILQSWGPELFLDKALDSNPGDVGFSFDSIALRDTECQIGVGGITVMPTDDTLNLIRFESERIKDRLELLGKMYARNRQLLLISKIQVDRAGESALATLNTFRSLVSAVYDGECNEPEQPTDSFLAGILIPEATVPGETCKTIKTPADFGLPTASWDKIDLQSLGVVVKNSSQDRYILNLDGSKGAWFFEAKLQRPNLAPALDNLIQIYSDLLSIELIKAQLQNSSVVITPETQSKQDLEDEMRRARAFIAAFRELSAKLKDSLDSLEKKLKSEQFENIRAT